MLTSTLTCELGFTHIIADSCIYSFTVAQKQTLELVRRQSLPASSSAEQEDQSQITTLNSSMQLQ